MIEELKMILEMVGDISGVALWVIGIFFLSKLVIYMATTGAIVILVRLFLNNTYNWAVKKKEPDNITTKHVWTFADDLCITADGTRSIIEEVLRKTAGKRSESTSYLHISDAQWLLDAVNEKSQREGDGD